MAAVLHFILLLFSLSAAPTQAADDNSPMTDEMALLLLKQSFTNTSALSSWTPRAPTGSPCDEQRPWTGVVCFRGIVTGLRLAGMGLGGTVNVDALAHFPGLRSVSLDGNRLSGPIPDFSKLPALKSLYLSGNDFAGPIPDSFFAKMTHLKRLWLSGNGFNGPIPSSLSAPKNLMELHLEGNQFTGQIPDLNLPSLKSFDVSGNYLSGPIPPSLSQFGPESFQGNKGLCGAKFTRRPCVDTPPPAPPSPHTAVPAPAASAEPTKQAAAASPLEDENVRKGRLTVVSVLLAISVILLLIAAVLAIRHKQRQRDVDNPGMKHNGEVAEAMESAEGGSKAFAAAGSGKGSSHKRQTDAGDQTSIRRNGSSRVGVAGAAELKLVNEEKGAFGLADLMKAAAEVLGNGGLGSAYKAVMSNGLAVVVKRLRELNRVGREAFDLELRLLGSLGHPNILTPLAYHFRKDEKLIVFEYIPRGSLLYLLHGDRGPDHAALDWIARMKMARGIARGMAYLHSKLSSSTELPHGNLKSSNILIGADNEPLLVDYGLVNLVNPTAVTHILFAYKSPESVQLRRVSPKSDVYCLGIVILELLTGKFPLQYLNNKEGGTDVAQWAASAMAERREAELLDPDILNGDRSALPHMEQLLRVAAACTEPSPDLRPEMREAAGRIEEIAIGAGIGGDDSNETAEALVRAMSRAESRGEQSSRRNSGDSFYSSSSSAPPPLHQWT